MGQHPDGLVGVMTPQPIVATLHQRSFRLFNFLNGHGLEFFPVNIVVGIGLGVNGQSSVGEDVNLQIGVVVGSSSWWREKRIIKKR